MNAYSFPEFSALPADTAQQLRQLITVHCTEGSHAHLSFFEQADSGWTLRLRCDAYIGRIYRDHGHIAVDCGAGFGMPLGCIRLDDFMEFYIP